MVALAAIALIVIPVFAVTIAAVFWLARLVVPVLIIGLGIWLIFATLGAFRRERPARWERDAWRRERRAWGARSAPTPPRPRPADPLVTPIAPGPAPKPADLPIDIEVKVEQIRRKVEVLLGYAERFPVFSQDLYLVRQTASDYLPRTLNAYKALAASGGAEVVAASGKTARDELREQIGLLDSKLDEITQNLQRRDLDQLLANRRFLEERFGHRSA